MTIYHVCFFSFSTSFFFSSCFKAISYIWCYSSPLINFWIFIRSSCSNFSREKPSKWRKHEIIVFRFPDDFFFVSQANYLNVIASAFLPSLPSCRRFKVFYFIFSIDLNGHLNLSLSAFFICLYQNRLVLVWNCWSFLSLFGIFTP